MGYWIVELSNGEPALITDDPSFCADSTFLVSSVGADGQREDMWDEILLRLSHDLFGEWDYFLAG